MQEERGYKKLIIYKKSKELVMETYKMCDALPKQEFFTLAPQIKRAAVSILLNIVEGYNKKSRKEYCRFIDISIGSANELEVLFELTRDLKYLKDNDYDALNNKLFEVKKMLYSFQKSLRSRV
jgi:four helix bundle protein